MGDLGNLLLGVAAVATVLASTWKNRAHGRKLDRVVSKVDTIDKAVNQVEPGKDTLTKRVDTVTDEARVAAQAAQQTLHAIVRVERTVGEMQRTQHATTSVIDHLAVGEAEAHDAIWAVLAEHGIDRRKPKEHS